MNELRKRAVVRHATKTLEQVTALAAETYCNITRQEPAAFTCDALVHFAQEAAVLAPMETMALLDALSAAIELPGHASTGEAVAIASRDLFRALTMKARHDHR